MSGSPANLKTSMADKMTRSSWERDVINHFAMHSDDYIYVERILMNGRVGPLSEQLELYARWGITVVNLNAISEAMQVLAKNSTAKMRWSTDDHERWEKHIEWLKFMNSSRPGKSGHRRKVFLLPVISPPIMVNSQHSKPNQSRTIEVQPETPVSTPNPQTQRILNAHTFRGFYPKGCIQPRWVGLINVLISTCEKTSKNGSFFFYFFKKVLVGRQKAKEPSHNTNVPCL